MGLRLFDDNGEPMVIKRYDCGRCKQRTFDERCKPITDGEQHVLMSTKEGTEVLCLFYDGGLYDYH